MEIARAREMVDISLMKKFEVSKNPVVHLLHSQRVYEVEVAVFPLIFKMNAVEVEFFYAKLDFKLISD